jgi:hypothetical protein
MNKAYVLDFDSFILRLGKKKPIPSLRPRYCQKQLSSTKYAGLTLVQIVPTISGPTLCGTVHLKKGRINNYCSYLHLNREPIGTIFNSA